MSFAGRTEVTKDDWQTPKYIVEALGSFDLDPCASVDDPYRLAPNAFFRGKNREGVWVGESAFQKKWFGRIFMNPPYGGIRPAKDWMKKLSQHGNGIALIPPRMGAAWFHDIVLSSCDTIFFVKGRIAFINPRTGQPVSGNNADSIFVAYGQKNVEALENCKLPGKLWSSINANS